MTNLYYGTVKQLLERVASVMVDREATEHLIDLVKEALEDGPVVEELGLGYIDGESVMVIKQNIGKSVTVAGCVIFLSSTVTCRITYEWAFVVLHTVSPLEVRGTLDKSTPT